MISTGLEVWKLLLAHSGRIGATSLRSLFEKDSARAEHLTRALSDGKDEIIVDFSKQLIDLDVLHELFALARETKVLDRFDAIRNGAETNSTERQAVLHTALRATPETTVTIGGVDVVAEVHAELKALRKFADSVRKGKKFKKIVSIGIGGSDLGPALVYEALSGRYQSDINCEFVANIDMVEITSVLANCDPNETLFIICSKTLTITETLANARYAKHWLASQFGVDADSETIAQHFVVVSAYPQRAAQAGINAANSFKIWPWVGGRFSVSSAMSLAPMIAFGSDVFDEFLAGMRSVDDHMQNTAPQNNVPLILGLIDVWNISVRGYASQAFLPYAYQLRGLPSYLQQLIMESNGKSVQDDGSVTSLRTSPVVWGGVGTTAQHAFFQMLHQGTDVVPVEFIGFAQSAHGQTVEHDVLIANMFAQARALAFGRTRAEVDAEVDAEVNSANVASKENAHRVMHGNRPSTTVLAPALTSRTLGALIAMYEHRVFVQGVVLGINSFDQWGVELGKSLAKQIASELSSEPLNVLSSELDNELTSETSSPQDASTRRLIDWYRQHR
ncbi:MAG: glucose-6-phosphate isomerase [Acidimicrobiaceae bacterium]|nr:glucose-6-phosphate isomerase [Acidimicrobiaceae bacterium]